MDNRSYHKLTLSLIKTFLFLFTFLPFYRHRLIKGAKGRWRMEGLNSLNYQLRSYNKESLYTHVYVSVNKSEVSKVSYLSWLNSILSISQEAIIKLIFSFYLYLG